MSSEKFEAYEGDEPYAFISYAHKDSKIVYPIINQLHDEGFRIWYDEGIPLVADYGGTLYNKISGCSQFIYFISKNSAASKEVEKEVLNAIGMKKTIVQIVIEDAKLPPTIAYHLTPFLQKLMMNNLDSSEFYGKLRTQLENCKGEAPAPKVILEPEVKPDPASEPTVEPKPEPTPKVQPEQTYQKAESTTSVFREPEKQNRPKSTTSVFQETEKQKPVSPAVINDTSDFLQKYRPAIAAVAIVLVVAIVIAFVVNIILNRTNDNLPDIKSVNDITSIDEISVGDHLKFGKYEQDGDIFNGKEIIEWRVLAIKDGKALLITEKLLDYVQYNDTYESVTWETCTLRKCMNEDFLNAAFTSSEQNKIATTTLGNPDNSTYNTEGGNDTEDKIFALSIDEAEKYFSSDGDRRAYVTEYAEAKGYAYDDGSDYWWLRSPGDLSRSAAYVINFGGVGTIGDLVSLHDVAVRPAFWLNL